MRAKVASIEVTFSSPDPQVILALRRLNELPERSIARLQGEAWLFTFLAAVTNRQIGELEERGYDMA